MTGSGAATGSCELGRVTVEFRSVNGRNLSLRFRTSPECAGVEGHVEQAVRRRLVRGSVVATLAVVESAPNENAAVDDRAFAAAAARLRKLARENELAAPTLHDVLAVPGVLVSSNSDRTRASWEPGRQLAQLVEDALDRLVARRVAEGEQTVVAMLAVLDGMLQELERVRARAPELVAQHRAAILERVNEFLAQHDTRLEPEQVIREVALFADRVDIAEELQRLDAHAVRLHEELRGSGPVGRDVEFLLQEMLREVNTLGSKSPDVDVAHRVVAMKSAIDKLKEQAANLE
ncbi:MAG: YicC family protein [Planctomycetes bacterium]|nr:YicC family protein [Planctomycetota bacterium]